MNLIKQEVKVLKLAHCLMKELTKSNINDINKFREDLTSLIFK